ncbi:MAG: FAD-binding oxidoreductase, partial [Jatrophihabitans sp.]
MSAAVVAQLRAALGERVLTGRSARELRAHDESHHGWQLPLAVVACDSTRTVAAALRICHEARCAVVPVGTGTGLEGGANATADCVSLDLSGMDRILRVSAEDLDATVEAGVTRLQLNNVLARDGMFFPVDPGADASLGGMASTRASGTNAVRYGTMRENVLALTVVLADGTVV